MHRRTLGDRGPEVGAIGLGCVGMSAEYSPDRMDDRASLEVIRRAVDLGVTLFDTADVYGPFTNELLVGRALAPHREQVVVASKVGLVEDPSTGRQRPDGRPEHLRSACRASLRRLGVERIDLHHLHRVDPDVPLAESWGAMARLVEEGLVGCIGLCEVGVDELETAHAIHPVATVQSELSLWTRGPLDEVLPWCERHGVGFIAYSPLGRGYLTGAVSSADFHPDDIRYGNPRFTPEAIRRNRHIVEAIGAVAESVGATRAQVALAWVLAQGPAVAPIPGTKRVSYLEENCAAADLRLDADALRALDDLPPPHGSRY